MASQTQLSQIKGFFHLKVLIITLLFLWHQAKTFHRLLITNK